MPDNLSNDHTPSDIQLAFEKRMAESRMKIIDPTLRYLSLLQQEREYTIESRFSSINGVKARVYQINQEFVFETGGLVLSPNFHKLRSIDYGFKDPFILRSEQFTFSIPQISALVRSQMLGQGMATKGQLRRILCKYVEADTYCRAVFFRKFNPFKNYSEYIQTNEFNKDNQVFCASGLFSLTVSNHVLDIVETYEDQTEYLFIDSTTPIRYTLFEKLIKSITHSFGFISGYLQRDGWFCMQSASSDFQVINGFRFESLEESVSTGLAVIDPRTIGELHGNEQEHYSKFQPNIFSNLVTKVFDDERMFRAVKIIAEGNAYPNEIRASAYSVALETVRNIIVEENSEKIVPIKNKAKAKLLKDKIKDLVNEMEADDFNDKEAIFKRINDFNQLPNKDSFKMAFSIVGIELTKEDIRCLESRNDFLHGRLPIDRAEHVESDIKYFTHKLHFLVCALILKYCGYYGWLLNSHKYLELFDSGYNKSVKEPTFRTI